jgi:hypothetical protein
LLYPSSISKTAITALVFASACGAHYAYSTLKLTNRLFLSLCYSKSVTICLRVEFNYYHFSKVLHERN